MLDLAGLENLVCVCSIFLCNAAVSELILPNIPWCSSLKPHDPPYTLYWAFLVKASAVGAGGPWYPG